MTDFTLIQEVGATPTPNLVEFINSIFLIELMLIAFS